MTNNENAPTLRDQFAMAVATGLSASDDIHLGGRDSDSQRLNRHYSNSVNLIAEAAYDIADAMLKEREK